jgi:hypothetical protein
MYQSVVPTRKELEWFIKGFIEMEISKLLFDSERNSRDMRFVRVLEAIFLVNWFLKQSGSEPSRFQRELLNHLQYL